MRTIETPATALQKMLADNETFIHKLKPGELDPIQHEQHPYMTVLTCCDSRVRIRAFLAEGPATDSVFVIRNIGNQLATNCGSVDYGVLHLKTPLLLVLGHTRCGAVKAACTDYRAETLHLVEELNGLHLPVRGFNPTGDTEVEWLKAVERNVHYQVDLCMQRYHKQIEDGTLAVAGSVYDFANLYQRETGRIVLLNLNGVVDPVKMREHDLIQSLPTELANQSLLP